MYTPRHRHAYTRPRHRHACTRGYTYEDAWGSHGMRNSTSSELAKLKDVHIGIRTRERTAEMPRSTRLKMQRCLDGHAHQSYMLVTALVRIA